MNPHQAVTIGFDVESSRLVQLAPPPQVAPRCPRCQRTGKMETTRPSNRKGNAGRDYYKCHPCNKFLVFVDYRGNDPSNPLCHCRASSKTQMAGPGKRVARGLHYVCRLGRCDFYQVYQNVQGQHLTVSSDDLAEHLINLSIV
ncbi:unnamed protein product [Penicillium salamii]|nr:unnamed protein product [Penicillium salamii]